MKVLFLVMDGAADISHPELDRLTPLQAAPTPGLDRLAQEGCCALMYPLAPGICPSSEVAHWRMFGYSREEFPGRAYLHALAAGLPCRDGDALFMLNFVRLERRPQGVFVVDEGYGFPGNLCSAWVDKLNRLAPEEPGMSLYHMGGIEFIAVLREGSCHLRPTDPFLHHLPVEGLQAAGGWEKEERTVETIKALEDFFAAAGEQLEGEGEKTRGTPGIIMKWPSRAGKVEAFERRHGMRAAAVVSTPCFKGMGKLLSMRVETVRGGEAGEELMAKLRVAQGLFQEGWEFVFVHIKHADEAAHGGDPAAKREVIAAMDRALEGFEGLREETDLLVVITADHATPTTLDSRVIHGGDPVPVLFHGRTVRIDCVERFDEISVTSGGLGQLEGKDMMPLMLYLSRRAPFYT